MKNGSRGYLILGIAFILSSLHWLFRIQNVAIGLIWLTAGLIELAIAGAVHRKEKGGK